MKIFLALIAMWLTTGAGVCLAQADSPETQTGQLPGLTEPDTVRTNLWLTKALMGEIVTTASAFLPPAPGSILLVNKGGGDQDELFGGVATGILSEKGYELFVVAADSTVQTPVDFVFSYQVVGVDLAYPEVGRTLGIWQRWVARDVAVTAAVEVSNSPEGQLLFKDTVERRFGDRVDNDDFDDVESDLYEFTTAETSGSGWQNRMEEIVVLGTLVGLIAIYFANTGN
ncbi:MAG: hypothetical protein KAH56_07150 [Candidatus Krumholzibacteria bacterium]|nr:hypothetical protein [Candidatus Krumholzibacteria bacterium]